ncbi:hypothetical protein BSL78_18081 [Apostichopus japonicus]|uniref:Uncharacterized protein n=1 Tax=Stichopus japonicus TaxID=307972 RepID=A0A2G8KAR0_STIJA|nr:hypothetical protein BSL78_18081 [Apostichopus japonicus]
MDGHLQETNCEHELSKAVFTPASFRKELREGKQYKQSTAGICAGYVQANVFMLPSEYFTDFQQFCLDNFGPLPLLLASAKGQFEAPILTVDESSDIRTDIPAYKVFKNGEHITTKQDLLEYTDVLKNYCFFYVGCSFSFDRLLISAGIPLRYTDGKGSGNVSMYKTNVMCKKRGHFNVELVVSMRPIRRDLIQRVFEISQPLTNAHGAPVHIGNPAILGISDLSLDEYYGCKTHLEPGEVPVFWACGVTGLEALKSVKSETTFSHCGGSMFITDLKLVEDKSSPSSLPKNQPRVTWLTDDPPLASVLSEAAYRELQQLIMDVKDIHGKQGNGTETERFLKEVLSLSHSRSIGIIMADVSASNEDYGSDTSDSLPDSLAMALYLQSLDKIVTCFCDPNFVTTLLKQMKQFHDAGSSLGSTLYIAACPNMSGDSNIGYKSFTSDVHKYLSNIESAVMIESHGSSLSITETDVSHFNLDILLLTASKTHDSNIPALSSDSPLGVVVLCKALYALYTDELHNRYRRRGLGYSLTDEEKNLLNISRLSLNEESIVHIVQLSDSMVR